MNRLGHEKSPYLLQHAGNPVDWYPWGEEAFERARREDRPIFLSIGYSTCHWCHVMERESFGDPEVARLLNEHFVSVKVDREERPDIDGLYMTVVQLLTGQGGWPMTILMTADQRPFFAATYVPKRSRYGRTGLLELLPRVAAAWKERRGEIDASGESILQALRRASRPRAGGGLPGEALLRRAYGELSGQFDEESGGFGTAPKFPSPHHLLFLLRWWRRSGEPRALRMVEKTLTAMRRGGVYDHVGFGFHRYSTDADWRVPHFEKMLYDQALLALAYTETFQATGRDFYAAVAREVLTYVLRDMTVPEGGFASAEDADSEGEEGRFYTWTRQELAGALGPAGLRALEDLYPVRPEGNFRGEASGRPAGRNVLYGRPPEGGVAPGLPAPLRRELFRAREARVRPLRDDKVLTGWNGLAIAALARAGAALEEPSFLEAAERAAAFLLERLRTPDGRLLHRWRDGEAAIPGYAEDYAFLAWGLIELYEATFDPARLRRAVELMDVLGEDFRDESGGFYLSAERAERLLVRRRDDADGALPSANSAALLDLLRLGRFTQDPDREGRAVELVRSVAGQAERSPLAFTFLLSGLDFLLGPAYEVVVAGDPSAADTRELVRALRGEFAPNKVVLLRPTGAGAEPPEIAELAPFTARQGGVGGRAAAWVCRNGACELPVTDSGALLRLLGVTVR